MRTESEARPRRHASGAEPAIDSLLRETEEEYARLRAQLAAVEARLRELRTNADLCPRCGGTGTHWVQGGMYGELQPHPCSCRRS